MDVQCTYTSNCLLKNPQAALQTIGRRPAWEVDGWGHFTKICATLLPRGGENCFGKKFHTFLKSLRGWWACLFGSVWIITSFFTLQCCLHMSLCSQSPIIRKNSGRMKIFKTNCKITKEKLLLKHKDFHLVKKKKKIFSPRSREV